MESGVGIKILHSKTQTQSKTLLKVHNKLNDIDKDEDKFKAKGKDKNTNGATGGDLHQCHWSSESITWDQLH